MRDLTPAEQWKELTGNPAGYCACLRDLSRADTVTFWLSRNARAGGIRGANAGRREARYARVCRRDEAVPLEPKNLSGWAAGWDGDDSLVVQLDVSKLAGQHLPRQGRGFAGKGKERVKWTSEPRKFQLPARQPNATGGYIMTK
ncbi:MAG: hypothetical protein U0797_12405 [Gemmataceae bacterium]